jgi:hypothetical protein
MQFINLLFNDEEVRYHPPSEKGMKSTSPESGEKLKIL